ncbi:MAG: 2-hydroxychromene-2-carboxylate isomerase [Burkholderiales bacterium]|nr:MAG: 2-hydroxychromene-2-carboxylate isomerase [Burkholderiales bacterium]
MSHSVDYYFAPQSPWMFLGHARFRELLRRTGSAVRVLPVDYGRIFPASGGIPLPQRAPQRQAYRLVELRRFSQWLGIPLNVQPRHFPVAGDPASLLITAVARADGAEAALDLIGAIGAAIWQRELDAADPDVLCQLLQELGLPAVRLDEAASGPVRLAYDEHTRQAIDAGVFGAPSYVVDGEIFWGQDRLELLAQRLAAAP